MISPSCDCGRSKSARGFWFANWNVSIAGVSCFVSVVACFEDVEHPKEMITKLMSIDLFIWVRLGVFCSYKIVRRLLKCKPKRSKRLLRNRINYLINALSAGFLLCKWLMPIAQWLTSQSHFRNNIEIRRLGRLKYGLSVFFFKGSLIVTQVARNWDVFLIKRDCLNKVIPQKHHEGHILDLLNKISSIPAHLQD